MKNDKRDDYDAALFKVNFQMSAKAASTSRCQRLRAQRCAWKFPRPAGQTSQIDVQLAGLNKPVVPFVTNLAYTALNQPKAWVWNHGLASLPPLTASRSFDTDGRMASNEFASYGFDAASRITSITQNLWATLDTTDPVTGAVTSSTFTTPLSWNAAYDNRNRLTSFGRNNASSSTSYTYDANSNRLSSINTTTSDTDQDGDFDAVDFSKTTSQALAVGAGSNQLLGFNQTLTTQRTNSQGNPVTSTANSQITYTLDANGNLTSDGLRLFEYDGQNRLAKVLVSQSAEASKISYLHNALGQRVFKSEPQVAQTAPDAATLGITFVDWLKKNFGWLFAQAQLNATLGQSYIYDDGNLGSTPVLLGEYGNGGNKSAGRIEYIYLPTEDGQTMPIGLMKANRFYAIQADHLNTPRLIRDDAYKPVWQWAYSAFGDNKPTGLLKATPNPKAAITNQPVLLKATNPLEINLRYPGQYFDEESNLSYNYFRSYQPTQGRYTQNDPIGLAGGSNRFAYVGGNALSFTDPLGLQHDARPRRPGWPDFMQPTQPSRNCVTAECAAGLRPTPSENRNTSEIENGQCRLVCGMTAGPIVNACLKFGGMTTIGSQLVGRYGTADFCQKVCE